MSILGNIVNEVEVSEKDVGKEISKLIAQSDKTLAALVKILDAAGADGAADMVADAASKVSDAEDAYNYMMED